MCGIAGTLELSDRSSDEDAIWKMVQAISHRGPDGTGVDSAARVGLGHSRLRVIDLSHRADQPMWNNDRSVALVFNGEIYNFRELRRELVTEGFRFETRSDTEVVLKLYESLGKAAIPKLDGMFALALWDGRKEELILARDRTGKKPLFYFHDGRRFAFASEIKALRAHPEIRPEPNLEALPLYLTYGYFPGPKTPYRDVHKLPPATLMSVSSSGTVESQRYWSPPYLANGVRRMDEAVQDLKELMNRAVSQRLVSDVPLGAFLSGGLDSTIVVGLMSRHMTRPVRTFSIGFDGHPEYDETQYAETVAKNFGTEHTTFRVQPPNPELLEVLVHQHDGPFGDSSAIPTYIVSRLARQQVTVVLNGDGGDELFAGYSRLAAAAITERFPQFLRRFGTSLAHLVPEPSSWSHPLRRVKRFLEAAELPLNEKIQAWCSFFPEATSDLLMGERSDDDEQVISDHFRIFLDEASSGTPLAQLLHLNFCTYLPEDLLVKMDRTTMAHGLEARSPFLDTKLIEFACRLPDRFKLRGIETKYILREAFKDLLPQSIMKRGKMGFGVPLGVWFKNPMKSYVMDLLGNPKSRLFELVKPDTVSSLLDQHMAGYRDLGQQLFCLLTLEIWLRSQ